MITQLLCRAVLSSVIFLIGCAVCAKMGNLFSNNEERERQERRARADAELDRLIRLAQLREQERRDVEDAKRWQLLQYREQQRRDEELARQLQTQLCLSRDNRTVKADQIILSRPNLITDMLSNYPETHQWEPDNANSSYSLILVPDYDYRYHELKRTFNKTNKSFYKVTQIAEIKNRYLYAKYKLKQLATGCYNVEQLYHGTKKTHLDAIFKENLNWRLHQRSKYGKGVSFSNISYYSTHYCDKDFDKIMLVVDVLVKNWSDGYKDLQLPATGYDTTKADDGKVTVKYDDFAFYPKYVIYYEGIDYSKKHNHRRN